MLVSSVLITLRSGEDHDAYKIYRIGSMPIIERRDRTGSDAGRGFRYQDSVAAALAIELWAEDSPGLVIPEGGDDIELRQKEVSTLVSVKSRRQTRGAFTASEIRTHIDGLLIRAPASNALNLRLVLERDVSGAGAQLAAERCGNVRIDVLPSPAEEAVARIEVALQCLPAAAHVAFAELRSRLAEHASENGPLTLAERKGLATAEIGHILAETIDLVDRESVEGAFGTGLIEAVDFVTPRQEKAFYLGVDVQPGHIAADLTVGRPREENDVEQGLEMRGRVVVCGPSGAGKSAVMWRAASGTRHAVRWYRLQNLTRDDLPALTRCLRALRADPTHPVGLVLDDAGRHLPEAWALATSLADSNPGLFLLASCREEDLGRLGPLQNTHLVRPRSDDALGEALWRKLSEEELTEWAGWREPWDRSNGLLMEYAHILTERTRLRAVLRDQVIARIADDDRDAEVDILRIVACAGASGARIDVALMRKALGFSTGTCSRALRRLVEEHVVRAEEDGFVAPLHHLRSKVLFDELGADPAVPASETVSLAVRCVVASDLPMFLGDHLAGNDTIEGIISACLQRLDQDPCPDVLVSILRGLGDADAARLGEAWLTTEDGSAIEVWTRPTVAMLALSGDDQIGDWMPAPMRTAARAYATLLRDWPSGCRRALLDCLNSADLQRTLGDGEITVLTEILEGILGVTPVSGEMVAYLNSIKPLSATLPFGQIVRLLAVAQGVAPDVARAWVAEVGQDVLLGLVFKNIPFTTEPRLELRDGMTVAVCEIVHIADGIGEEPHAAVVALCDTLFALCPDADRTDVEAVDVDGVRLGFRGYDTAVKRIPRSNDFSKAQVEWNRRLIRAIPRVSEIESRTAFLSAALDIANRLSPVLERAWDRLVRGKPPLERDVEEIGRCYEATQKLVSPIFIFDKENGEHDSYEIIRHALVELSSNSLRRFAGMPEGANALAAWSGELGHRVAHALQDPMWSLLPDPNLAPFQEFEVLLQRLRLIAWDHGRRDERAASPRPETKRARRNNALATAARLAERAEKDEVSRIEEQIKQVLRQNNMTGAVHLVTSGADGVPVLAMDVVVTLDVMDVLEAVAIAREAYDALRADLISNMRLAVVPKHPKGVLLSLSWSGYYAPTPGEAGINEEVRILLLDHGLAQTPLVDAVSAALEAATILGNLRRAGRGGNRSASVERRAMDDAVSALDRAREVMAVHLNGHPDFKADVESMLASLEAEGRPISTDLSAMESGETDAQGATRGLLMIEGLHLDLD